MQLTDAFTLSEDVVAREVGEETMLLDLASGTYFGLNPVGGRFWQLLEEGRSAAEARDCLLEEFDVDPTTLDADLGDLLDQLAQRGLIAAG
ncbi:MAG: PqqD family protein [Novosphingobium meiothermophilum]|uniref:PqqD family protein n=1 Tax=Novosphingobium TaxID=165696 RepID=UPI000D6DE8BF|nr:MULTISPECIES: PqqD family protein [Novosphingobium]